MAATSVGTSAATLYTAAAGSPAMPETVVVQNKHASNALYVLVFRASAEYGDTSVTEVTTANGVEIAAGAAMSFDLRLGDYLRVIADGASTDVRWTVLAGI